MLDEDATGPGAGVPLKLERLDSDGVCIGFPFTLGSACKEGAREEVPVDLQDGDGVGGVGSLGSGLAEGDG